MGWRLLPRVRSYPLPRARNQAVDEARGGRLSCGRSWGGAGMGSDRKATLGHIQPLNARFFLDIGSRLR